jgi:hypothetical protein
MTSLKKFIISLILLTICLTHSIAQKVETGKEMQRIKGTNVEGHFTQLEGTPDEVNAALTKYLKSFGKLKFAANPITVTEFVIGGTQYTSPLYGLVKDEGASKAWIGIKKEEWSDSVKAKTVDKELSRVIYEFGVSFYRDKIQVQVDESMRAQQAVERQQQRLANENKSLLLQLENNQREKVQLEKSLDVNKLEYLNLLLKIEQNKKMTDSLNTTLEQVKKVVESHKEKQKKVN